MASVLNFLARIVFIASALLLLAVLLVLGLVLGLVWWVMALLTGRRRPDARVWAGRMQQRAQDIRRRAHGKGEVVEAEVREIQ